MKKHSLKPILAVALLLSFNSLCLATEQKGAERAPVANLQGGADAGGANFVGTEIYDDYENEGVRDLTPAEVLQIAAPVLENLSKKVPAFAEKLKVAAKDIKWHLDPKPLKQTGSCLNNTMLTIERDVRACQSKVSVRIDYNFFEKNSSVQTPMVVHELLVFQLLRSKTITEEGLRDTSRTIRDFSKSANEIVVTLARDGFGDFLTAEQISANKIAAAKEAALRAKMHRQFCHDRPYDSSDVGRAFVASYFCSP